MKKIVILSLLFLCSFAGAFAQGMQHNRVSPHDTVKSSHITVTYGRPYKKGRTIFGSLEAYGKVWRAGADEATQITVDKDFVFAGKKVKAGTYALFVIPQPKEWTIILNSKLGQWGAFGYESVKDKDVAKVIVPVRKATNTIEQFTITPSDKGLQMGWDETTAFVPIDVK